MEKKETEISYTNQFECILKLQDLDGQNDLEVIQ